MAIAPAADAAAVASEANSHRLLDSATTATIMAQVLGFNLRRSRMLFIRDVIRILGRFWSRNIAILDSRNLISFLIWRVKDSVGRLQRYFRHVEWQTSSGKKCHDRLPRRRDE